LPVTVFGSPPPHASASCFMARVLSFSPWGDVLLLPAAQTIVEIRHMMYNVRVHSEKATEVVARYMI
jgi:hypothetical protein